MKIRKASVHLMKFNRVSKSLIYFLAKNWMFLIFKGSVKIDLHSFTLQ